MSELASLWDRLTALLVAQDYSALALAVLDLADAERRSLNAPLKDVLRNRYEPHPYRSEAGLGIVAAAAAPDARTLTRMLRAFYLRYSIHRHDSEFPPLGGQFEDKTTVPHVHYVLRERRPPWLADLVGSLARVLPKDPRYRDDLFDLIERLRGDTGAPMPVTDGYVGLWARTRSEKGDIVEAVRADPAGAEAVDRMLQLDSVTGYLSTDERLIHGLVCLVEQRSLDRASVLDAVLDRMAQRIRPGAAKAYLAIHDGLDPTTQEVEARIPQYLAALRGATASTVASRIHELLLRVDARHAPIDDVAAMVTTAALGRPEKKIVRAQLAALRQTPATVSLAAAVAVATSQLPSDLARDAAIVLGAMATELPEDERKKVVAAASALPKSDGDGGNSNTITDRPTWAPMRRISDFDELAARLEALMHDASTAIDLESFEMSIEALVRWAGLAELEAAVRPALRRGRYVYLRQQAIYRSDDTAVHFVDLVAAAIGDPPGPELRHVTPTLAPERLLQLRLRDLATHVRLGWRGGVVATPTSTDGRLTCAELCARLEAAMDGGWEPLETDLEQALLRVRAASPDEIDRFTALGTPAGASVARALCSGEQRMPTLGITRRSVKPTAPDLAQLDGDPPLLLTIGPANDDPPFGELHRKLTSLDGPQDRPYVDQSYLRCWHACWPGQPDVIAAHYIAELAAARTRSSKLPAVLPLLAAQVTDNQTSALGLSYALAFGLAVNRSAERRPAVSAVVDLARTGRLDPDALAAAVLDLASHGDVPVKRVTDALRPAIAGNGATVLWPLLAALVATMIATASPVSGAAEVLRLCADAAEHVRPTDSISGLGDFAGRHGSSRQLLEARRLLTLLTG